MTGWVPKLRRVFMPIALIVVLAAGYWLGSADRGLPVELDAVPGGDLLSIDEASSGLRYNGPACMDDDKVGAGQPKPYCGALPSLAAVNVREASLEELPVSFESPWAFEFLAGDEILVTEFGGSLKRADIAIASSVDIAGLPEIAGGHGQRGLLDVAIHPRYSDNRLIYFSYVISNSEGQYATAVARAQLLEDRLTNLEQIFVALPFGKSSSNFGGALEFDRDGYLYIGTGDRSDRSDAQHPGLLTGKIIRLNDDGSIPADNPFVGDANEGADASVYALGVRNPQGLVCDPVTGRIYETEHGPMGGDEVNLIEPGRNYGWPVITYGMNYTYRPVGEGTEKQGMEQPLYYYLPSIAVSPVTVYRGQMFPEWDGDLLVGALKGQAISKLDLVAGRVQSEYQILGELNGRVRDIKVAGDGAVWVLLETGSLFRLSRDTQHSPFAMQSGERDGEQIYLAVCAACHSQSVPGVPQLAVKSDWTGPLAKGKKTLYRNAIEGYRAMPEKGLCEDCTPKEVKRAVNFMLGQVQ
jgi:glucose/arabinose dehydrogenase